MMLSAIYLMSCETPSFAIPLFKQEESKNEYFSQTLDENYNIENYHRFEFIDPIRLKSKKFERHGETTSIGRPGMFVIELSKNDFRIGNISRIRSAFLNNEWEQELCMHPFMKLEIARLLKSDQDIERYTIECGKHLFSLSKQVGRLWIKNYPKLSENDITSPIDTLRWGDTDQKVIRILINNLFIDSFDYVIKYKYKDNRSNFFNNVFSLSFGSGYVERIIHSILDEKVPFQRFEEEVIEYFNIEGATTLEKILPNLDLRAHSGTDAATKRYPTVFQSGEKRATIRTDKVIAETANRVAREIASLLNIGKERSLGYFLQYYIKFEKQVLYEEILAHAKEQHIQFQL